MSEIITEEELLLEKKLSTDFTFGFELEAVWIGSAGAHDDYEEEEYDFDGCGGDIDHFFNSAGLPGGDLHGDCSLSTDGRGGTTFEWASPVLPFTVASIQKVINMFKKGLGREFVVNDSCGFHNHISFNDISLEDVIWIMSKLALDDRARELFTSFEGIQFVTHWSGAEYLDNLKQAIEENDYKNIVKYCATDKYSVVNVHYNKTLEWRGPRGFLEEEDMGIIIKFYQRLQKIVSWIIDVLDETEINGIEKSNYLEMAIAALPNGRKQIQRFTSSKKIKGLFTEETLGKVYDKIINGDLGVLFKFIGHEKPFEQIIQRLYNRNRLGKIVQRINNDENKNEGNVILLNNVCYKYIPYRICVDYFDTITKETLDTSSTLTLNRLLQTAKKDGEDIQMNQKLNILGKIMTRADAHIISYDNFPNLYSVTSGWEYGSYPAVKVIFKNDFVSHIENIQSMFEGLINTAPEDKIPEILELFKNTPVSAKPVFSKLTDAVLKYPEFLKTLDEDQIKFLVYRARQFGNVEKVLKTLVNSGIITPEKEVEWNAELTKNVTDKFDTNIVDIMGKDDEDLV